MSQLARTTIDLGSLKIPPCALPRPGDSVLWYERALPISGHLLGHTQNCAPCVKTEWDATVVLHSYDSIRLVEPDKPVGPNWTHLPPSANVVRPTRAEQDRFAELLGRRIPNGTRYIDLIGEIWSRGHEVFLTAGAVRDIIADRECRDVDIATTMPLEKLFRIVDGMYEGTIRFDNENRSNGQLTLGGAPGTTDPFVDIRVFRHLWPGTPRAIFGSSFEQDTAYRDFACNSLYFDPINNALIDPTGYGLSDAADSRLRAVYNAKLRTHLQIAEIGVRMIKFCVQGYSAADGHEEELQELARHTGTLPSIELVSFVKSQVFRGLSEAERTIAYDLMRQMFVALGEERLWDARYGPYREELLSA
ncbi:hypothetical protein AB0H43_12865 [Hamadaea sp. NPDC050747]|uniref:hypothetical protein n=1 Tax=Hamadaea sp. NPDC050747 TaxID=3155789 RepID=UPI0033DAF738